MAADFEQVKQNITDTIYENGEELITGQVMQDRLLEMVSVTEEAINDVTIDPTVNVTVNNTTGTPSGSASFQNNQFSFEFSGIKGETGNSGYTGAAGELEVVNNLTSDDATAALSAYQGKVLDGKVHETKRSIDELDIVVGTRSDKNIDFSSYQGYPYFVDGSGKWQNAQNANTFTKLIPIGAGTYKLRASSTQSIYAILSSDVITVGSAAPFAVVDGTRLSSRTSVAAGVETTITIDGQSDALFLAVRTDTSGVLPPQYFKIVAGIKLATLDQVNYLVNKEGDVVVGSASSDFDVVPNVSYSAKTLRVPFYIPANQSFYVTVQDLTSVSSGKYSLNLFYSDGTSSNPVNPEINSTIERTATKDIIAVGAYITSGKITTGGKLNIAVVNPATIGETVKNTVEKLNTITDRVDVVESELSGVITRDFSVKPNTVYDFPDIRVPIHIPQGAKFSFSLRDVTSTSSGAYALRQFYVDGTYENTSSNPALNSTYNGTAAKEIVALAAYVSTGKITVAGILEAQAYNSASVGESYYTVGANGNYQTFTAMLRGLKDVPGKKVVYVDPGEYDIFEELGGADYVNSIDPSITAWSDIADFVPADTTIIGKGRVVLKWLPEASQIGSDAMANLFSPLNIRYNCRIENIEIDCQNCRYGIHDETGENVKGTIHEFVNVKVTHREDTYGLKYAYGAGHAGKSVRKFKDCEFVAYYGNVWSTHDWAAGADEGSLFVFDNCLIYDPRDATHTPVIFTTSNTTERIDKVRFNNSYVPNKMYVYSGSASGTYNQTFDITMVGCNPITLSRSSNITDTMDVRQFLQAN